MELQPRRTCFACGSVEHCKVWRVSDVLVLMRCRRCGSEWLTGKTDHEQSYHYVDPSPLQQDYYRYRAGQFAQYLARVAPIARIPAGVHRLLDIGCGDGSFLLKAKAMGWDVTGTELDPADARRVAENTGLPVLAGDLSDQAQFSAAAGTWQAISMWCVLAHVRDPDALLTRCVEILATGGVLAIDTPNPRGLFRRLSLVLAHLSGGRVQAPLRNTLGAGHVVWYSRKGIAEATRRAGLRVVDVGGGRNYTRILLARWDETPPLARWLFKTATIAANHLAGPLGMPNRIQGVWQVPARATSSNMSASE